MPNRLIHENSPYLLQHAHNPVDWYPWGEEAFAEARKLNRPIFLSVGYSTCYWCHVMERQSFENPAIAAEMNRRFINIKVDREQRPDVDQLYMMALQLMARQGGWPMSMFLLPDLRPFYGGTYFPPDDAYGRPGFPRLLGAIDEAFHQRRDEVEKSAAQVLQMLRRTAEPTALDHAITIDEKWISDFAHRCILGFDPVNGGFGDAPKFPRQTLLEFILVYLRGTKNSQMRSMLRLTLDKMACGGMRDQLGGGFHRYSTDSQWLVPHFEIMLYDNAMLAWVYAEAFSQWGEKRDSEIARGICDFVLREMTSPGGAFYTAFDAEVDAEEGGNYLWTRAQVQDALKAAISPAIIDRFCQLYGLDDGPNFADPHTGGRAEKNVLFISDPEIIFDADMKMARQALLKIRAQRKQPMLDTKILTGWNGLMIRGLAFAGKVLKEDRYIEAANRAMDDVMKRPLKLLDDYAPIVAALLELGREESAKKFADEMMQGFYDPQNGGFYSTQANAPDLILRQKIASDSPLPNGNGLAAQCFIALDQPDIARSTLQVFAGQLEQFGESMSAVATAAMQYVRKYGAIDVEEKADGAIAADEVVSIRVERVSDTLRKVHLNIREAFHLNAHGELGGLNVSSNPSSQVIYPDAEDSELDFKGAPLRVYRGEITVEIKFGAPVGKAEFAVTFQACDDDACLAPARKAIEE